MQQDTVTADSLRQDPTQGMLFVPPEPERFRAGFYFCNSLIQLMENVYHDLNLKNEHDHPDNSGWMNLFRQWAWSGMFRVTWTISAATYGRRFRSFCHRYLDLKVGEVAAREIGPALCEALQTLPDDPSLTPACEGVTLNALERQQIAHIIKNHCACTCTVYQLDLAVNKPKALGFPDNKSKPLFAFNFGYAVVSNNRLIMFRVQDHLRNMNLGRRGLKELLKEEKNRGLEFITEDTDKLLDELNEAKVEKRLERFHAMLESVKAELGINKQGSDGN